MSAPSEIGPDEVERFLADRLRGRPIPADLYRLVQLQLSGALDRPGTPGQLGYTRLIEPGVTHPLADPSYLTEADRSDHGVMANVAAIDTVLAHTAQLGEDEDGSLYGYWMHPDEKETVVIRIDSEGDLAVVEVHTLAAAMLQRYRDADQWRELHAEVVAWDAELGRALATEADAPLPAPTVDPVQLRLATEDAARRRLYADVIDRVAHAAPDPALAADGDRLVELIGADLEGPELASVIVALGVADQVGRYTVDAVTTHGLALTFLPAGRLGPDVNRHLLASVTFSRQYAGRLPRGLSFTDTPESARAKLGGPEPRGPSLIVNADTWRAEPLRLVAYYDDDNRVRRVLADHMS